MDDINLIIFARDTNTHSTLVQLRKEGFTPGILYGNNNENKTIQVDTKELMRQIKKHGKSGILNVTIDKKIVPVKINEIQKDLINGEIMHVDFQLIDMSKIVYMKIPIITFGQSIGEKKGGTIQQQLREIEVKALPSSIPESIHVNISDLDIGYSIFVRDLIIPEDVEKLNEPNEMILTILSPKNIEEKEESIPTSEPEVVNAKDSHGIDAAK